MSRVFLIGATGQDDSAALARKVEALWRAATLDEILGKSDLTALKLHVGEPGNTTFVRPAIVTPIVRCIAATGAQPFLTDTAVLYKSPRDNGVGHTRVAHEHGFDLANTGAPFIPADGINGDEAVEVAVDGKHFETVAIATAIMHARSIVVLSHATGHLGAGYGGALKNLGMGCSAKKAKLQQHHGHHPRIDPDLCTACGTCVSWCPSDAISVDSVDDARDAAVIDSELCIGCGECMAVCLDDAVRFPWSIMGKELQERIVEHAAAVARSKAGHIGYITVAMSMTKDCDCIGKVQSPLVDDIGILAGRDPVALDKAVLDLVAQRSGKTLDVHAYPKRNGMAQINYAEAFGLGQSTYELVTVTP